MKEPRPYREGREAYERGDPPSANPYRRDERNNEESEMWHYWSEGYQDAARKDG